MAGLGIGAGGVGWPSLAERWGRYREQAAFHARQEDLSTFWATCYDRKAVESRGAPHAIAEWAKMAATARDEATLHARLRREYERRW